MGMRREDGVLYAIVIASWVVFGIKVLFHLGSDGWSEGQAHVDEIQLLKSALEKSPVTPLEEKHPIQGTSFAPEVMKKNRAKLASNRAKWPRNGSIDLNNVDSAGLESLPFLGPVLASRVCKFRDRLGGFWSVEQLREVWGLKSDVADQIIPWFHVGNGIFRFLCVDTASWYQLHSHPYINQEGARTIERFRNHHPLSSIQDLRNAVPINDSLFQLWSPYLRVCETAALPTP